MCVSTKGARECGKGVAQFVSQSGVSGQEGEGVDGLEKQIRQCV